jgi:hypothetical protein
MDTITTWRAWHTCRQMIGCPQVAWSPVLLPHSHSSTSRTLNERRLRRKRQEYHHMGHPHRRAAVRPLGPQRYRLRAARLRRRRAHLRLLGQVLRFFLLALFAWLLCLYVCLCACSCVNRVHAYHCTVDCIVFSILVSEITVRIYVLEIW